jgi:hypothetical protein
MFGGKNNPFKSLMMSSPKSVDTVAAPEAVAITHPEDATATAPQPASTSTNHVATPDTDAEKTGENSAAVEKPRAAKHADSPSLPSIRVSSIEVERESQKVRSLYESGDDLNWEDGGRVSFAERLEPTVEVPSEEEENVVYGFSFGSRACVHCLAQY